MADYKHAFRDRLKEPGALTDLLGGRINWGQRLQGSPLPACCLHVTSDPRPVHFSDRQALRQTRIQIDFYSDLSIDIAVQAAELALLLIGVPFVKSDIRFDMPTVEGPETSGNQEERIYVHRARLDVLAWHAPV